MASAGTGSTFAVVPLLDQEDFIEQEDRRQAVDLRRVLLLDQEDLIKRENRRQAGLAGRPRARTRMSNY